MYRVDYTFVLETEEGPKRFHKGDIVSFKEIEKYGLESFVSKLNDYESL